MIQVENLKKDFKKTVKDPGIIGSVKALFNPKHEIINAVNNVTFNVAKGEILGFIGPNGAGKSTVIKMLTGILTPTSGVCRINGQIPTENRKKYVKEIGVVFGQRTQLWWDLPLNETYTVLKEIYDVSDSDYKNRMDFLDDVLNLKEFIKSPVRTLSLGQRMRADIAAAMLHNPKVLFLDEPTIGLDVVVKDSIRKAIHKINADEKTTVILTTHDLSDIELLCERIVMIDKGKKIYDGKLQGLKDEFGQMRELSFIVNDTEEIKRLEYEKEFKISSGDHNLEMNTEGQKVTVRFNSAEIPVTDILSYTLKKINIKDINVKDADIEEIIRRLYKREVSL